MIHQEKMTGNRLRKIVQQLLLMCYMLKIYICNLPRFQNTTQILKKNHSFNDS